MFKNILIKLSVFLIVVLLLSKTSLAKEPLLKVGVLAKRGVEQATQQWSATAEFLSENIKGYRFKIIPLGFEEILPKVATEDIDFLIANPSVYIEMETLYGVSRLATMKNIGLEGVGLTVFGGVIFTKADRNDINTLNDLLNISSFMAVKENSLGGFQTAWQELKKINIDPYTDFEKLIFRSKHDLVVYAVANGEVDVGTVRTDTLERMAHEGKINLDDFKVIGSGYGEGIKNFPYKVSTMLVPEWPFAKLSHTSDDVAQAVTIALLEMQASDKAAVLGKNVGWTVPLNYQPIRTLMQELHLGPFRDFGKVSLSKFFDEYWRWIIAFIITFTILLVLLSYILKINGKLKYSEKVLTTEVNERQKAEISLAEHSKKLQEQIKQNSLSLAYLEKIRKFHELTSLLITTLNPKALLQKALDRIVELSESEIGGIYLVDSVNQTMSPFVFHGISAKAMGNVGFGESLPAQVVADNKRRHIKKIPENCILMVDFGFAKSCPKELLMLPMQSKDKVLGVIILGSLKEYSDDDLEVLSHMSDQMSIMLENALTNESMEHLSMCDGLTGLYNRRHLNERLLSEVKKVHRIGQNLSLLILDVDYFKKINDQFGHPVGDKVLTTLSQTIQAQVRDIDIVGRFGGEEFMVIMPSTNIEGAKITAEKIRNSIAQLKFNELNFKAITISVGVSTYAGNGIDSAEELIQITDQALYKAKANGRNQSYVYQK